MLSSLETSGHVSIPMQESPCSGSQQSEIINSQADVFQTCSLTQGLIFMILFLFLKA